MGKLPVPHLWRPHQKRKSKLLGVCLFRKTATVVYFLLRKVLFLVREQNDQISRVPLSSVPGFYSRTHQEPVWKGWGERARGEVNLPKPLHRSRAGKRSPGRVRS